MSFDGFFRQQWLGFNGAPQTGYASIMYPFVDLNMSAGAYLYNDATGPINRTGLKINYSYRLNDFLTDDGILAIGISGNMQSFRFNAAGQQFNDEQDVLILGSNEGTFFPAVGVGLYFNSHPIDFDREQNSFYTGIAFNQAYTTDVLISESNFQRQRHLHFLVGGKIMGYESFIEPSISANYVNPQIIDFIMSVKYEREDAFWAGLGYSSVSDLAIQGGWILDDFLGNRYAKLRIGALANMVVTDFSKEAGPSLEMFIRYEIDID
jgi:type IX secretion system PorP/SprF family membrane protein